MRGRTSRSYRPVKILRYPKAFTNVEWAHEFMYIYSLILSNLVLQSSDIFLYEIRDLKFDSYRQILDRYFTTKWKWVGWHRTNCSWLQKLETLLIWTLKRFQMASMASCHTLATLSCINPLPSHKNTTPIANLKSQERTLQSSPVGTALIIGKTMSSKIGITSSSAVTCSASASSFSTLPSALLFDCDGVLVDTEKDGHRISFNNTFKEVIFHTGFSCFWSIAVIFFYW